MMENRGRRYQSDFSTSHYEDMHDREGRERKARTIVAVMRDFAGHESCAFSVLDVGASTGIIDSHLAQLFGSVCGLDIDEKAIQYAQETFTSSNLRFGVGDAMNIQMPDGTFDAVICAQVYEHVPDADKLMSEIYRVLKPGGVCYFAATNRLHIQERHYNLPLLSVIPRPLGHLYVRAAGKGEAYYERHLSLWGLRRLVRRFLIHDYTKRIIEAPPMYHAEYMLPKGSMRTALARLVVRHAYWLCPGYVWILQKE